MRHRVSSSESGSRSKGDGLQDGAENIRTKPPRIYDNITRRLMQFGVTLGITTFIGLIVRYAVKEFDPSVSTITVTTARVDNKDIASFSVSKNFLERILEFIAESISIVGVIIPLGFPLCTLFNRYFGKIRAGSRRFEIKNNEVLSMIPKYLIIGDSLACHLPTSLSVQENQLKLRPLVRDAIFHLIKARLKPKLIVEDSFDDARKLGIKIGLIGRNHHKLAVIKSVDLLKQITDSRGDIKQGKVRYLLSRMKIMSQSTPADKSLLIYLIKHCERMPNENLAYLAYSFTDPEAMRLADCAMTFQDCDDDDVKRGAHVILKSDSGSFTDIYLFLVVCLITSNITQSYALYQISASVSSCIYRFLCITVFQEQLLSHSQFVLMISLQQVFAILALMTKWLSSLPQSQMKASEISTHVATSTTLIRMSSGGPMAPDHHRLAVSSIELNGTNGGGAIAAPRQYIETSNRASVGHQQHPHSRSAISLTSASNEGPYEVGSSSEQQASCEQEGPEQLAAGHRHRHSSQRSRMVNKGETDDTLDSSASLSDDDENASGSDNGPTSPADGLAAGNHRHQRRSGKRARRERRHRLEPGARAAHNTITSSMSRLSNVALEPVPRPVHLSGVDLNRAIINSKVATNYKQTFHNLPIIDDVTYRLAKLHIAYQILVMIIIIIFGNAMFQLNMKNNRQHQTLALNSLIMNNLFNLANCFNQFGEFNLRAGIRNHPFFLCILLFSVAFQVCMTELNAFGLENMNPSQWFVCFVFALMSTLIAPLTGQQRSQRLKAEAKGASGLTLAQSQRVLAVHHEGAFRRQQQMNSTRSGRSSGAPKRYLNEHNV